MSYYVIQAMKDQGGIQQPGVEVTQCDTVEQVLEEFARFEYFYLPTGDAIDGAIGEVFTDTEKTKILVINGSVVLPETVSSVGLVHEDDVVNGSSLQ